MRPGAAMSRESCFHTCCGPAGVGVASVTDVPRRGSWLVTGWVGVCYCGSPGRPLSWSQPAWLVPNLFWVLSCGPSGSKVVLRFRNQISPLRRGFLLCGPGMWGPQLWWLLPPDADVDWECVTQRADYPSRHAGQGAGFCMAPVSLSDRRSTAPVPVS